jgi:hypothetical protein
LQDKRRAALTGAELSAADEHPAEDVQQPSVNKRRGVTSWIVDSINKRFLQGRRSAGTADTDGSGMGSDAGARAVLPAWQLSRFMLRKTYNAYCNAVDSEAMRLNVRQVIRGLAAPLHAEFCTVNGSLAHDP